MRLLSFVVVAVMLAPLVAAQEKAEEMVTMGLAAFGSSKQRMNAEIVQNPVSASILILRSLRGPRSDR